jgi:hypothetical protein
MRIKIFNSVIIDPEITWYKNSDFRFIPKFLCWPDETTNWSHLYICWFKFETALGSVKTNHQIKNSQFGFVEKSKK